MTPLVYSSVLATTILKQFVYHLVACFDKQVTSPFNQMSPSHRNSLATDISAVIVPEAIMIKNIPLNWKNRHLLHLISQMNLPCPYDLFFLYDRFDAFRGMAFAAFSSPDEARLVMQKLDYHRVAGRRLRVQYRRKPMLTITEENVSSGSHALFDNCPPSNLRGMAHASPPGTVSSAPTPTSRHAPPSESYDLLMRYQTDPLEKEKLRKIFAQTRDYLEAVNEFAKNRVRETQVAEHQRIMANGAVLDMKPASRREWAQRAAIERSCGVRGEASSSGSLVNHEWSQGVVSVAKEGQLLSINPTSFEKRKERPSAVPGIELDEGKDGEGIEEKSLGGGAGQQDGKDTGTHQKQR